MDHQRPAQQGLSNPLRPASVRIQENLNHGDPGQSASAAGNILCLRCHVAPEAEKAVASSPVWFSDGVGCESCHGPPANGCRST